MSLIKLAPYIIDSTLDFTFNNVTATGNLVSLNANLGNLATANYFSGSGNNLSNIQAANITGQVGNALVAGTVYTAAQPNITSVGTLTSITTSGDGSIGGNLTVTGNLTVSGTVTSVNSTTVNINDINLVLANNATTAAQANGGGITINGASATMIYNSTSNAFVFSHPISANGALLTSIAGANVTGFVPNANVANTAYSVAAANVTGLGNIATINKDGNASNILYGNGVFAAAPAPGSSYGDSNVASYLPTYTGNLSAGNLSVSGNIIDSAGDLTISTSSGGNLSLSATGSGQLILDGLKWPTSDGTAGYLLKTDGAGNLSWTSSGGGGSSTLVGLTDVNVTTPTNNQVLSYDSATSKWINKNASSGGTGASVTVSGTAPTSPSNGDLWLDSESGELNVYFGGAWGSVSETSPQLLSMVNTFTGDSLTTQYTLSTTPAAIEYTLVAVGGVLQPRATYSLSGNVITFSSAIPSNTPIEITVLGGAAAPIGLATAVTSSSQPNITSTGTLVDLSVTGNLKLNNTPVATTGKSIAMAIVFGF